MSGYRGRQDDSRSQRHQGPYAVPPSQGSRSGPNQGRGNQGGGAMRGSHDERDRHQAPYHGSQRQSGQQSRQYQGAEGYRRGGDNRGYGQEGSHRYEGASGGYGRSEPRQYQDYGDNYRRDERGRGQGRYQEGGYSQGPGRYQGQQGSGQGGRGQQHFRQAGDYGHQQERPLPHSDNRGAGEGAKSNNAVVDMMSKLTMKRSAGNQVFLAGKRGLLEAGHEVGSFVDKRVVTKGKQGSKVQLRTNLFKFDLGADKKFSHYDISFSPVIESTRLKRKLLAMIENTLGIEKQYVTDGSSLFTTAMLNEVQGQEVPFRDVVYKLDIKKVATVQTNSRHIIQVLNVIFGNIVQNDLGYRWDAGNYYNYAAKINVNGTSLSAYPGFFTSILEYEQGTRLMLDVSHKIITSQNAWEACGYDYRKARSKLIGKIVYTCYNGKTYKVDDVDINKNIDCTFSYKGRTISIKDYYNEKYGIAPSDPRQPMLVVKPNRREQRAGAPDVIYLVPEFCLITGIDERDRTNRNLMTKLDEVTKPNADVRAKKMLDFAKMLNKSESAKGVLESFGIKYSDEMDVVEGRILPAINLPRTNVKLAAPLNKWIILHGNDMRPGDVNNFVGGLMGSMRQIGMTCKNPIVQQYNNVSEMQDHLSHCPRDTDMVVIILRGNNKMEYSSAKTTLCVNNPIPSQVVTSFVAQKNKPAIYSKIALQINCKMGGAGWTLRDMNTSDTMIIGVDTYHDSLTRGASYMGVVATMNSDCTRYFTTWSKQDAGREIAVNFRSLMAECMKAYRSFNGKACRRVIVYRDGVGDGQLEHLLKTEVKGVEDALRELGWKSTGVLYIVVKKRVHARFFTSDLYQNVPKGTVVDSVATRPCWMDFYLVNQKANQGTLTPTHFNVLLNSTDMNIDAIQQLSYQQCFMYFNWNDSIRVPATCQYAHKVAFLIGQALHHYPDGKLNNKLFYL